MANANAESVVIIKRPKKGGDHAHHGGAWKVAYADFVTAMMAFFLLLWLLNATTEVQKQGIADYFSPVAVSTSSGGAGGLLGGQSISSPGAAVSRTAVPSVSLKIEPTSGSTAGDAEVEGGADENTATAMESPEQAAKANAERIARERAIKEENGRFDDVEKNIRAAIQNTPALKELENHLLIDRTPEGMRIQVVDREGKPMFPSASAKMFERTEALIKVIADAIKPMPNKIRIAGHTDSLPFNRKDGYSNWELSSDRAQASRRVLVAAGLEPDRIASVVGRAARDPLLPEDTKSPRNRRVSILLLRTTPPAAAPTGTATAVKPRAGEKPRKFDKDWTGPRVR